MNDKFIFAFGCLLSAALVIGIAVHAGITRPFTQVFDADLHYLYRAFRFNSGLKQAYFDHTGYLYTLILSWWLQLGQLFTIIPEATIEGIRASSQPGVAMAEAIYFCRIFSILWTLLFIAVVAFGCACIAGDRIFGAAVSILAAASGGSAFLTITIRPELTSALCLFLAFLLILRSSGEMEPARLLYVATAAAFGYLAILTKMQAIIPLVFLPLVALSCHPLKVPENGTSCRIDFDSISLFLGAILIFLPFAISHYFGVTSLRRAAVPIYSWALVAYIVGAILVYGRIYRLPARETLRAGSALMIGLGVAFFVNYFNFDHALSAAHGQILDNLKHYSAPNNSPSLAIILFSDIDGYIRLAQHLAKTVGPTFQSLISVGTMIQFSQAFLAWLVLILAVPVYWLGNKRGTILMLLLLTASIATKGVFLLRSRIFYEPYFQFMLLLALAIAYATLKDHWPRWCRTAAVLIPVFLAVPLVIQNHKFLVAGVYHTPHISQADFCENQKIWAPILSESAYIADRCWPHYAQGIGSARINFPLFGKPPSVPLSSDR